MTHLITNKFRSKIGIQFPDFNIKRTVTGVSIPIYSPLWVLEPRPLPTLTNEPQELVYSNSCWKRRYGRHRKNLQDHHESTNILKQDQEKRKTVYQYISIKPTFVS